MDMIYCWRTHGRNAGHDQSSDETFYFLFISSTSLRTSGIHFKDSHRPRKQQGIVINHKIHRQHRCYVMRTQLHRQKSASRGTLARILTDDFEVLNFIASGAYGKVFHVQEKETERHYAIKQSAKKPARRSDMCFSDTEIAVKERKILIELKESQYIITLHKAFQDSLNLYLLLEFCPADFEGIIPLLTIDEKKRFLVELAEGIAYIHSHGILHNDLKPKNLLLATTGHLRIADFGSSKQIIKGRKITGKH